MNRLLILITNLCFTFQEEGPRKYYEVRQSNIKRSKDCRTAAPYFCVTLVFADREHNTFLNRNNLRKKMCSQ